MRGNFFKVTWRNDDNEILRTPLSFEIETHEQQIERYISYGFFSLKEKMKYFEKGKLKKKQIYEEIDKGRITKKVQDFKNIFSKTQECYVTKSTFEFKEDFLQYDPREYCNFFDKDSFSILYDPNEQSYVVRSEHHPKGNVQPKTVFMVYGSGRDPVLGSHALPHVKLGRGEQYIALPGLVFKVTYGVNYYI